MRGIRFGHLVSETSRDRTLCNMAKKNPLRRSNLVETTVSNSPLAISQVSFFLSLPTRFPCVGLRSPAQSEPTPRTASTSRNPHRASALSWEMALDEVGRTHDGDGGACRRSRAPSRKAKEAAGKTESEGAQWMTKEKREEQARLSEKLRRQRKAAAAAGLRAGEVLEEYHVPAMPIDAGAPPPVDEADASSFDGGSGSDRTRGARKESRGVRSGRKASRTETAVQGTQAQHPVNVATRPPAGRDAAPAFAGGSCTGALSNDRNDGTATGGSTAPRRDGPSGARQRRSIGKKKRDTLAEQACKGAGNRSRAGLGNAGARGRNEIAKETKCEFQNCSKIATFGVNLTVRYW